MSRTSCIVDEGIENADGVAAAADAGDDRVGKPSGQPLNLLSRLPADDGLELADHQRIRMRTKRRAEQVVGIADMRDPVAHGLVDRVFQGPAAGVDADDLGAQQPHAKHVERLALHVFSAHVYVALEAEQRAGCGRRDAVLAGAGFGDDPTLAHPRGEQRLTEGVVDLVRAGMRQIFALQEDAAPPERLGETPRFVDRRRADPRNAPAADPAPPESPHPPGRRNTRARAPRWARPASREQTVRRTRRNTPARPDRAGLCALHHVRLPALDVTARSSLKSAASRP